MAKHAVLLRDTSFNELILDTHKKRQNKTKVAMIYIYIYIYTNMYINMYIEYCI